MNVIAQQSLSSVDHEPRVAEGGREAVRGTNMASALENKGRDEERLKGWALQIQQLRALLKKSAAQKWRSAGQTLVEILSPVLIM